jgi:hypothetical protein
VERIFSHIVYIETVNSDNSKRSLRCPSTGCGFTERTASPYQESPINFKWMFDFLSFFWFVDRNDKGRPKLSDHRKCVPSSLHSFLTLSYSSRELDVPEQGTVSTAPLFVHYLTLIKVSECRATHSSCWTSLPCFLQPRGLVSCILVGFVFVVRIFGVEFGVLRKLR